MNKYHSDGDKGFYINRRLLREDALKICGLNGKLNREVFEYTNGTKVYFVNDEFHREDGPAVEFSSGAKVYFINGEFHREDGPAVEFPHGPKYYYINGKLHREDGPAVEFPCGTKYYYINGEELTEESYKIKRRLKTRQEQ
jgi:hypothetical protein